LLVIGIWIRIQEFLTRFYHCGIGDAASWVRQEYENSEASGSQSERLKGCIGGGLRCSCASSYLRQGVVYSPTSLCSSVIGIIQKLLIKSLHLYTTRNVLRETQTLRAGCSKVEPKFFAPPQTSFPAAQHGQYLISWRWSLYLYL